MNEILQTNVKDEKGTLQRWILMGDFGHTGEGNALQTLDRLKELNYCNVGVACHERLTVAASNLQYKVSRRQSLEDVMVLTIMDRAVDTRAKSSNEVLFFAELVQVDGNRSTPR